MAKKTREERKQPPRRHRRRVWFFCYRCEKLWPRYNLMHDLCIKDMRLCMDKDLAVRVPVDYMERFTTWQQVARDPDINRIMSDTHRLAINAYLDAPRTRSIVAYITDEEHEHVKKLARAAGLSVNKYTRQCLGLRDKPSAEAMGGNEEPLAETSGSPS